MDPTRRAALVVVLLVCVVPVAGAAEPVDPADLFPAEALAYAELHNPALLAPGLAGAVKGSVLEDAVGFIHKRLDTTKDPADAMGKDELAILALLASPEMSAEFKKMRGVALGLTGFTQSAQPNGALVVLTGDSSAAGLAAKAFLTTGSLRKVGMVGDVAVYQSRQPRFVFDPNTGQQRLDDTPPKEGPYEATYAYVPGLFVVGTNRQAVAEVVTRYKGTAKGALSATPAFREAVAAHRKPGVFVFANVPTFCEKFEAANKNGMGEPDPTIYGWAKLILSAKATRYVTGSVRFRDGGLAVTLAGALDPAQKSPLRDALAGPGASVEWLQYAPAPASLATVIRFPEQGRSEAVIGFLDTLAKAAGVIGRLPSDAIKEIESKSKAPLTGGLIGKTKGVTIVVPLRQELPPEAMPLPLFVLHTEGPDVAAGWEELFPRLVGDLAGGPPPAASSETLNGIKVLTLAGVAFPWKAPIHFARKDTVFVVGLDRKRVAAAAAGELAGSVVAGSGVVAPVGDDAPPLLGVLNLGGVVRQLAEAPKLSGPVVPKPTPAPVQPGFARPPGMDGGVTEKQKEAETKAWSPLQTTLDALSPATLTGRRVGNEVRFEIWQPKVQGGGFAPVIAAWVGWYDVLLSRSADPNMGMYGRARFWR